MTTRLLTLILLLSLATGCGWQLRGSTAAPLSGTLVALESRLATADVLRVTHHILEQSGAVIVPGKDQAEVVLSLLTESTHRRPLSLDRNARVQEFELVYRLRFSVVEAAGDYLLGPESVRVTRSFRHDREDVLATEAREARLLEELKNDAARIMLSRALAAIVSAR